MTIVPSGTLRLDKTRGSAEDTTKCEPFESFFILRDGRDLLPAFLPGDELGFLLISSPLVCLDGVMAGCCAKAERRTCDSVECEGLGMFVFDVCGDDGSWCATSAAAISLPMSRLQFNIISFPPKRREDGNRQKCVRNTSENRQQYGFMKSETARKIVE